MSQCVAELIYPAGQIDRCDRESHPKHHGHHTQHTSSTWIDWYGHNGRTRAWEESQWQVRATWKLAGRTDPPPLYEFGPQFVGDAHA